MDLSPSSVPLMRDCIAGKASSDGVPMGPALSAVVVFTIFVILGFALTLTFSEKTLFLYSLTTGIILAIATFFLAGKLARILPGFQPLDRVITRYQPYLQKLNQAGFEAAAESSKAVIRLAMSIAKTQPNIFRAADESLHFFVARLVNISDAKSLLGDAQDLHRQFAKLQSALHVRMQLESTGKKPTPIERASLDTQISNIQVRLDRMEEINRAAVSLTTELNALRATVEASVIARLGGEEEARRGAEMLKLQIDRERRINEEQRSLGL